MLKLVLACLLVCGVLAFKGITPPTFNISLDLPPRERWAHIMPQYIEPVKYLIQSFKNKTRLPDYFFKIAEVLGKHYRDKEFVEEIDGMAT